MTKAPSSRRNPFAVKIKPPYRVMLLGSAHDLEESLNDAFEEGYDLDEVIHTVTKGPEAGDTQWYTLIVRLHGVRERKR